MSDPNTDHPEQHEEFIEQSADRAPTPDEESAAEKAAGQFDTERVGEHFREMTEKGAEVRGEGQIEP